MHSAFLLADFLMQCLIILNPSKLLLKASHAWNVISQIFDTSVKWSAHPAVFSLIFHGIVSTI